MSPKLEVQQNQTVHRLLPFSPFLFLCLFVTGENFTSTVEIQGAGMEVTAKKNVDHGPAGLTVQGDVWGWEVWSSTWQTHHQSFPLCHDAKLTLVLMQFPGNTPPNRKRQCVWENCFRKIQCLSTMKDNKNITSFFSSFPFKMEFSFSENRRYVFIYSAECVHSFRNVLQGLLPRFGYIVT